jgi:alpha-tubulin suppressor-like RCC1 family protein
MAIICAGYNASMQMGGGHPGSTPAKLTISPDNLVCLTSGEDHTVFVDIHGKAHALGDDEDFAIGTDDRMMYGDLTTLDLVNVVSAHCGPYYSAYLLQNGTLHICSMARPSHPTIFKPSFPIVFVAGSAKSPSAIDSTGRIYLFHDDPEQPPTEAVLTQPVYDICSSEYFSLAIGIDGTAYGSGFLNNENAEFVEIPSLVGVKCKSAFGYAGRAGVVTHNGEVFVCGYGEEGQLGLGESVIEVSEFTKVEGFDRKKIVMASAGLSHTLFLAEDGKVFGCGLNRDGVLLLPESADDNVHVPRELPVGETISWIVCGQLQSFLVTGTSALKHQGASHFSIY